MALSIERAREHTAKFMEMFGHSIIVKRPSATEDSMGRPVSPTESTVGTFTGDIQFLTKADEELIRQGWATVGDARVFFKNSADVQEKDVLESNGIRWIVTRVVDAPEIGGATDFQEFIAKSMGPSQYEPLGLSAANWIRATADDTLTGYDDNEDVMGTLTLSQSINDLYGYGALTFANGYVYAISGLVDSGAWKIDIRTGEVTAISTGISGRPSGICWNGTYFLVCWNYASSAISRVNVYDSNWNFIQTDNPGFSKRAYAMSFDYDHDRYFIVDQGVDSSYKQWLMDWSLGGGFTNKNQYPFSSSGSDSDYYNDNWYPNNGQTRLYYNLAEFTGSTIFTGGWGTTSPFCRVVTW